MDFVSVGWPMRPAATSDLFARMVHWITAFRHPSVLRFKTPLISHTTAAGRRSWSMTSVLVLVSPGPTRKTLALPVTAEGASLAAGSGSGAVAPAT